MKLNPRKIQIKTTTQEMKPAKEYDNTKTSGENAYLDGTKKKTMKAEVTKVKQLRAVRREAI